MPTYNDYNETSITRGGFVPRRLNIQGPSIEVFANALNKIDTRHKEALAQRNQIMAAVGQLDLNEAEDEFKLNYIKDIQNQIDSEVEYGSYSGALTKATELAGNILADPKVIGRVRAQQNYKKFLDDTRNRKDISEDIKDWAIAQNPYHYEDKTDANGNVIGGSKWEAKVTPVSTVSNAAIIDKIKDWVTADEGSTVSNIKFDGNNVAYQVRDQWKTLSGEKLQKALDLALETVPGAKASLHQDYQVADWKYNNLSDEDKNQANVIASDIIAPNGEKYTEQQFIQKRFQGVADVLGYNNRSKEVQYNTAYSSLLDARQKAKEEKEAAGAAGTGLGSLFGYDRPMPKSVGTPINVDVTDRFNKAYGNTQKAVEGIEKLMAWKSNSKWRNFINNGDYNGAADYLQNYLKSYAKDAPALNNAITPYLMELVNSGSLIQDISDGLSDNERDALSFSAAYDSNDVLPANNAFSTSFNKVKNRYGGKNSVATRFELNDSSMINDILKKAGFNSVGEARAAGLRIGVDNKRPYIEIDKQNRYWDRLRKAYNSTSDPFFHLPWNSSRVVGIDSNGNKVDTIEKRTWLERQFTRNWTRNENGDIGLTINDDQYLDNIVDRVNSYKNDINTATQAYTDVMEVNTYELPAIAEANRKKAAGLITEGDFNSEVKYAKDALRERLISTAWPQVNVYAYDEKTQSLVPLSNEERVKIGPYLSGALTDDNTVVDFADFGIGEGIHIKPAGTVNSKGQLVRPENLAESYIVVSDRLTDEAMMNYKKDTARRAAIEYNNRKGRGGSYMLEDGTKISNISNTGASINGQSITPIDAVKLMDADQIVKEAIVRINTALPQNQSILENKPMYDRAVVFAIAAAKAEGANVEIKDNQFVDINGRTRVEHHLNTIITNVDK